MTHTDTQSQITILGGPNRWDFMLSLFDESDGGKRRTINFKIRGIPGVDILYDNYNVVIEGVERTARDTWHFKGTIEENRGRIEGEYSTSDRRGWYTFSNT